MMTLIKLKELGLYPKNFFKGAGVGLRVQERTGLT